MRQRYRVSERHTDMPLQRLRVFILVAEELNFTRVAELLYMAQPAVSRHIQLLEKEVDLTLFERTSRTVKLTAAGQRFYDAVRPGFELVENALHAAHEQRRTDRRTLALAHSPSVADSVLGTIVRWLDRNGANISIRAHEAPTGGVEALMESEDVAVGITRFPTVTPAHETITLLDEPLIAAVSDSDRRFQDGRTIDLAELTDMPLMIWPRSQAPRYYDALLAACDDAGLVPSTTIEENNFMDSHAYRIEEGEAFALLPRSSKFRLGKGIIGVDLDTSATLPLVLVFERGSRDPLVSAFVEHMRTMVDQDLFS